MKIYRQRERGQASIIIIFFMLMGVTLSGLVLEFAHLLIVRGELQNDADAASTFGSMQLDSDGVRESNGAVIDVLSPGGASPAGAHISQYMVNSGYSSEEWSWEWGRCSLQINLFRKTPTVFFSFIGIEEVTVKVSSKAKLSNSANPNGCG